MNGKSCILVIIFSIFFSTYTFAQHIQFSQYYSAPLVLAPSFAGMTKGSRIVLNYRDQWPNIPGTFTSYAFSYDQYFPKMKSGVGVLIARDKAGSAELSLTDLGIQYSYNIKVNNNWHIRPGLYFKYSQRSINHSKLVFGDQLNLTGEDEAVSIDEEFDNIDKWKNYIDFAFSTIMFSEKYWFGFNAKSLLQPNQSLLGYESRAPIEITVFGGMKIYKEKNYRKRKKNDASYTISFFYKNLPQYGYDQFDVGCYWNKAGISVGVWYRGMPAFLSSTPVYVSNVDAVIFMAGYKYNNLSFAYSYDLTVSELISHTGGSNEISIIYEFNTKIKIDQKRKREQIPCPF